MDEESPRVISKNMPLTINAGLLALLVVGVWSLAYRVQVWETKLDQLERNAKYRWTFQMEREAWREFKQSGEIPDVDAIKENYNFP
jgi:hypothetical protein